MRTPPFFVSFPSFETLAVATAGHITSAEMATAQELVEMRFPPVTSIGMLSVLFGYSPRFIGTMMRRPTKYYRRFEIRKGSGFREIWAPRVSLKVVQKWFGHYLNRAIEWPEHVHGFVPGRSTVSAAQVHCPSEWMLSIDIENFFSSVKQEVVFAMFCALRYPRPAAHLLVDLLTLFQYLPQGSPASPVLANLAFRNTDDALAKLAQTHQIRITRYADDISLSGVGAMPRGILDEIRSIVEADGWKLAENKTRVMMRPNPIKVLGLLVHGDQPRLHRKYRNRLRMMRFQLDKGYVTSEEKIRQWHGHLAYQESVEGA